MPDLSIIFGALFAFGLAVWRLVLRVRKDAVEDVQNLDKLRDALHGDTIRRDTQEARELTNHEILTLSDDDLDKRLHEARADTATR